ncbi:hypothetical protein DRQ09_04605 [candidate division KSB1 bacterium]|nr:MAG: hypothetical protein DRQ09_04605 [candidate division KSB1 bacterium]
MIIVISIIVLIIISGFFSGSETALTAVNIFKLRHKVEKKSRKARKTFELIKNPEDFLTTTLVGTNIANVTSTALATYFFVNLVGKAGTIISTIIMTSLLLLFGEIIPKGIFLYNADKLAIKISSIIFSLKIIFTPVSFIARSISRGIMFLLSVKEKTESYFVTKEEINLILKEVERKNIIQAKQKTMLHKIFDFTITPAEKVLVKNDDVIFIEYSFDKKKVKEIAKSYGYTRYPVKKDSRIIGLLNIFDIFYNKGDWKKFIRSISYFNSSEPIDEILKEMKLKNETMAVITKNSDILGIITLEDIMEHIVGDIKNEWDRIG